MSASLVLILAIVIVSAAIMSGVPLPLVFAGSIVWIVFAQGLNPIMIAQIGYNSITAFILLAIPLFIIGGVVMSNSRIGPYIVEWFECFFGRVKASMCIVSTCSFALFSAVSGSGMAILSCLGPLLYPSMKDRGYPPNVVAAMMCCAAPLGLLFPPSITQILFAWSANLSVLACFLAIIIPGFICAILITIVSMVLVRRSKHELTLTPKREFKDWGIHTLKTTGKAFPGLLMPVIVLGGIYSGIMTVTESASVAAVYAILVALFIYRDLTFKTLTKVLSDAGVTAGIIMFGIFFIIPFSRMLLQEGLPDMILDSLLSVSDNKFVVLAMINVFMILIAMVMDDVCATLLVGVVLTPIMRGIAVSPYQFAAIVGVNLGFGLITPPTAPFLYFTSRITGVPVADMLKPVFFIIMFAYIPALILTTYIPQISLWIPQMVMGDRLTLF